MKPVMIFLAALCLSVSLQAQQLEISQPRKAVRTSGDVGAVLLPVAGLTAILIEKDWQGLKQGALAGITTLGVTYALKYAVKKERPRPQRQSFISVHAYLCIFYSCLFHPATLRMEMGTSCLCGLHLCRLEPCIRKKT